MELKPGTDSEAQHQIEEARIRRWYPLQAKPLLHLPCLGTVSRCHEPLTTPLVAARHGETGSSGMMLLLLGRHCLVS